MKSRMIRLVVVEAERGKFEVVEPRYVERALRPGDKYVDVRGGEDVETAEQLRGDVGSIVNIALEEMSSKGKVTLESVQQRLSQEGYRARVEYKGFDYTIMEHDISSSSGHGMKSKMVR